MEREKEAKYSDKLEREREKERQTDTDRQTNARIYTFDTGSHKSYFVLCTELVTKAFISFNH